MESLAANPNDPALENTHLIGVLVVHAIMTCASAIYQAIEKAANGTGQDATDQYDWP